MCHKFPLADQHGRKEHVASTSVGNTDHILDHLDQVSSMDGHQLLSSSDTWG